MNKKILFITHTKAQCGVYEFGDEIFNAISSSSRYQFIKAEINSLKELLNLIDTHAPSAIIYNYHPSVMPWLCTKLSKGVYKNNVAHIKIPQIGIIHEITQEVADTATNHRGRYVKGSSQRKLNSLFDYYIASDPTLLLQNPIVYKTGRLIPEYNKQKPTPVNTFGSFGFGTPKKGFEEVVRKVQQEFDEATIRLNIPAADFGDKNAENAKLIAQNCADLIHKPGIKLQVTHDYMSKGQLLDFLAGNTMNIFLYEDKDGRGLSSAVDNALAVKRPVAISDCTMFRHILSARPSVCVENNSLKTILQNGFTPLEKLSSDWNKENLVWNYERILNSIFNAEQSVQRKEGLIKTLKGRFKGLFSSKKSKHFTWLRDTISAAKDDLTPIQGLNYTPVNIPSDSSLNRILDDSARALYKPAADKLFELVPLTMSKKIDRANVQQAFVFDTVYRNIKNYNNPKMLCVGSYEDTASMGLNRFGYEVEEIDPMINYYLQDYYTKPTTVKNSYQIIFSTSVIEHDPDDKSFMQCIEGLLAPGGIAVITCDYKDGWKPGEPKPEVDARFYTKQDLEQRLLSYIPTCELVDTPHWDCPNPDFHYLGKYQYTFATFVVRKKNS
jgi:SAM-dependent methyltransferase